MKLVFVLFVVWFTTGCAAAFETDEISPLVDANNLTREELVTSAQSIFEQARRVDTDEELGELAGRLAVRAHRLRQESKRRAPYDGPHPSPPERDGGTVVIACHPGFTYSYDEELTSLAFELYALTRTLREPEPLLLFYEAELAFGVRNWPRASGLYRRYLELAPDGRHADEAVHAHSIAWYEQRTVKDFDAYWANLWKTHHGGVDAIAETTGLHPRSAAYLQKQLNRDRE